MQISKLEISHIKRRVFFGMHFFIELTYLACMKIRMHYASVVLYANFISFCCYPVSFHVNQECLRAGF